MSRNNKHAVNEQMWTIKQLEPKLLLSADLMSGKHEITGNIEKSGEQKQYEFIVTEKTKFIIDITKSLEEQAKNTVTLFNDILMVARNSIYDKKASIALDIKNNIESLEELITKHSRDDLFGDPMWKKMIDDVFDRNQLEQKIPYATSCFVAGTVVHTDKGLVPIEQLKVGDMVLSMLESGSTKDKAYKRVVKTFKSKQKQLIMSPVGDIYCTDNHPFGTKDEGWKAAKILDMNTDLVYALGMDCAGCYDYPQYVTNGKGYWRDLYEIGGLYLLPTPIEGVAVCLESNDYNIRSENHASLIDFRNGQQQYIYSDEGFSDLYELSPDKYSEVAKDIYSHIFYDALSGEGVGEPFSDYVYNIEVEDYHTYFVGEYGYWVHNANCQQVVKEIVTKTRI